MTDDRTANLADEQAADGAATDARIQRAATEPLRVGLKWEQLWEDADGGLISAWERGRSKAAEADGMDLAGRAMAGELIVLPWKGGTTQMVKSGKIGSLLYLAMWQGLRNEDLDIWTDRETTKVCTATGTHVTFSPDLQKVASA